MYIHNRRRNKYTRSSLTTTKPVNEYVIGLGAMVYPDGSRYRGQWAYNQRHGRGTYFYKNGDKYSGQWKEGKRHGNGVFVFTKTESQLVGTFENGEMVSG